MKIYIYILPLILLSFSFYGQTNHKYLDIYTGVNMSNLSNESKTLEALYNNRFLPFLKVGYLEILKSGFGYKLDGGYSMRGATYDIKDDIFSNKYTFHFVDVSLMGVYGIEIIPFNDLKNVLITSIGLGFNLGFPIFSSSELKINDPNLTEKEIRNNYPFLGEKDPVSEGEIKNFNPAFCMEWGMRYRISDYGMLNLTLRYDYGLFNIEREKNIPTRTFTRDFFIGIGYTFILHNLLISN